ncbi:MAG: hypothetical protein R3305_07510, partial [Gammaproteobacteria bacterium]|nr:hypothetical protein [Gammaproteobacteria bacterium]
MDRVHELYIEIAPEDYAKMREDLETLGPNFPGFGGQNSQIPQGRGFRGGFGRDGAVPQLTTRDPIYVPVTVTYEGETLSHVGMRYKGNSSLMSARMTGTGKVPFRLDFD